MAIASTCDARSLDDRDLLLWTLVSDPSPPGGSYLQQLDHSVLSGSRHLVQQALVTPAGHPGVVKQSSGFWFLMVIATGLQWDV
ncbi:hypothetical protein PoB_000044600 [Plakobranchus ocellatus]|uniref:Uncharacterized protein n=1 Tax=Plakobranchus ocellatus TaxID=259542 RepID=A0AAV3WTU4_9GAST|nr:hypothetical protein PoB_000044600 [Plakobranchus ocellatus]